MTIMQVASLLWLVWNVLVFISYGIDKGKARQGYFRIPEKTLLLISLFGGLGALFGGHFFHHKTRKWYFQLTWYVAAILNIGLMYLLWRRFG